VVLQVQRRFQAGVGEENRPALRRGGVVVLAQQLAVKLGKVRVGELFLAGVEALEVHVHEGAKAIALELVEDGFHFAGHQSGFGAVLEVRVDREIAGALADRPALADVDEQHQVVLGGLVRQPVQRLEDVLLGGGLALALGVLLAQEQTNMIGIDAKVTGLVKTSYRSLASASACLRGRIWGSLYWSMPTTTT